MMATKREKLLSLRNLNNNGVDRISGLPIPMIHHVLSFLPIENVIQTCVLSKHWRNIWSSIPILNFDAVPYDEWDDFFKFMDTVLLLRDGSDIERLSLTMVEMNDELHEINMWILHAIRHNVQVLEIDLHMYREDSNYDTDPDTNSKLTPRIFNCASLRKLKLSCNKFLYLPASICLPALRKLQIGNVIINDGQIFEVLLSATPSLETLILCSCVFNCSLLTISSTLLKNLDMSGFFPSVVIYAPNLVSLNLMISHRLPATIRIKDTLLSLTDATINISPICYQTAGHLISMVRSAQSLSLKSSYFQFPPFLTALKKDLSILNLIKSPFSNLKSLRIQTHYMDAELIFIHFILKHSPHIESLILAGPLVVSSTIQGEQVEDNKVWSNYDLPNLKLVEIQGFKGSENEVKLVKFFLENASVLEKLIITIAKCEDPSLAHKYNQEIMKTGRNILTYSRASSSLGVLFAQNVRMM
ncbi:hypothetical protein ACHQM5_024985 [Ranunculus cassubicifolius]